MFVFKKHLDRRTFLRSMSATVALPLLDAMVPARTALAATAARPTPRMAFVYFPHGAIMDAWAPAAGSGALELGPVLEPLAPFRQRLTLVSGLENRHAYGPVHAITPGTWLSGASPRACRTAAQGTTADQLAADHLGQETLLRSLEVATEEPKRIGAGAWQGDYAESYATTVSFRSASTPLPMEFSPRRVFDRMFARRTVVDEGIVGAPRAVSILDLVAADAADLRTRLGPADRTLLRDYLDTLRDIEQRVEQAHAPRHAPDASSAEAADAFADRLRLMFDMVALAFRADITRVASCMMAAETSAMTYDHLGVPESFHLLSHHQHDPEKIAKLVRIQRFHTQAFSTFVRTLAELPDGDGSMLDHLLMLYGSNMSNSHLHDHFPLPVAVVGGGCGSVRGGRHLRCPDRTPLASLLLTMLRRAAVPAASIGDCTDECVDL